MFGGVLSGRHFIGQTQRLLPQFLRFSLEKFVNLSICRYFNFLESPQKMFVKLSNQSLLKVNSDSLIGEGTKIGDKALVKRSVIGKNCVIGEKSKITNSILMDNVQIGEGVVIHGSIICSGSILYQKSEFKDCLVSFEQDVITSGKYSNETIKNVETYIDMDQKIETIYLKIFHSKIKFKF